MLTVTVCLAQDGTIALLQSLSFIGSDAATKESILAVATAITSHLKRGSVVTGVVRRRAFVTLLLVWWCVVSHSLLYLTVSTRASHAL